MFNLTKEEITFEAIEAFCREWQEGIRVEYKQQLTKDIPKIVSSFANTQGGIFIIGVNANQTDNKVLFPIQGIPKTEGIEERIVQSAITGIYPSVIPEVSIIEVPDTDNVIIVVRNISDKPISKRYQTGKRWSCLSPKKLKAIYRIQ